MLDSTAQLQQEALGILGVNLVHGALSKGGQHYPVVAGLMDDLTRSRIEVWSGLQAGRSNMMTAVHVLHHCSDKEFVSHCMRRAEYTSSTMFCLANELSMALVAFGYLLGRVLAHWALALQYLLIILTANFDSLASLK